MLRAGPWKHQPDIAKDAWKCLVTIAGFTKQTNPHHPWQSILSVPFPFLRNMVLLQLTKQIPIPACYLNGMMVHHLRICSHHVSIWFYRKGYRINQFFWGGTVASGHEPCSAWGGKTKPIKICAAAKVPGNVVSFPSKMSAVIRAKLTDTGKQPCAVLWTSP